MNTHCLFQAIFKVFVSAVTGFSMVSMILPRRMKLFLLKRLRDGPVVVLSGPMKVGKTTLAFDIAREKGAVYMDLETGRGPSRVMEPGDSLERSPGRLVLLDGICRFRGDLDAFLDSLVDPGKTRLCLFLGCFSPDSLGRYLGRLRAGASFLHLEPLDILEVTEIAGTGYMERLWVRGGFPESFLAGDEGQSMRWRKDYIRLVTEKGGYCGPCNPWSGMRRHSPDAIYSLLLALARHQGELLNLSRLGREAGLEAGSVKTYIRGLENLFLLRRLPSWRGCPGKRGVKSPRIYIRDSGLLHALLALSGIREILSSPVREDSWKGFVIQNLLAVAPEGVEAYFYRKAGGAEIDLVLRFPGNRLWAVDIGYNVPWLPPPGALSAWRDLKPSRKYVVHTGNETCRLEEGAWAVPLPRLARELAETG